MAIEFSCSNCQRMLRVPDGTEGELCECPACQTELTIPNQESVVEVAAEPESGQIQVCCPHCQHALVCDSRLVGTKGQCKGCQQIFVISTSPTAARAELPSHVFSCPKCDQLFEGKEEMRGRKGKCHSCGELFAIELRKLQPPSAVQSGQSGANSPPQEGDIRIQCSECNGIMEVPAASAGKTTACPYCRQLLQIPLLD